MTGEEDRYADIEVDVLDDAGVGPGSSCRPSSLRQSDLERKARKVADDLTEFPNGTVTQGG